MIRHIRQQIGTAPGFRWRELKDGKRVKEEIPLLRETIIDTNKYQPHQGKRECARRAARMAE